MINEEIIKKFLNNLENKELLNQKDFDSLYTNFSFYLKDEDKNRVYKLTEYLNKIGIDPLIYINEIPYKYYKGSKIKEIKIPKNIKSTDIEVFANCNNLENIIIPENVRKLGISTFEDCKNLQEVKLLGVRELESWCFCNCPKLQKVTFPITIKAIGEDIFNKCPRLFEVYYEGTKEQWKNVGVATNNKQLFNCIIYCTDGALKFLRRSNKEKRYYVHSSEYYYVTNIILWQDISTIGLVKEVRMRDPEYAYVWNRLQEEKKKVSPLVLEKIWKYIDEYKEINKNSTSK